MEIEEISKAELQALIQRAEHAVEHGLALEAEDVQLLIKGCILCWCSRAK